MGIFPEMLMSVMCGDIITVTTSCADLGCCHSVNQIGSILHSNSYYTVVAGILVPSATSCKTIHGVKSVRSRDYFQPLEILSTATRPSHAN